MKEYDREYFDRWYRRRETRIFSPADLRRRVAAVVGITEDLLGRTLRSVLDIGCGEARWRAPLRALRPRLSYLGLETSSYAVERFGTSRNVRRGSFGDLSLVQDGPFDLVLAVDMLHYVPTPDVDRGLDALLPLMSGVAYLDVTVREDRPGGDLEGWIPRNAAWYRDRFTAAGLIHVGLMCWIPKSDERCLSGMEKPSIIDS